MISNVDSKLIQSRFHENGIRLERLVLQNGAYALISERGGHIFGPFIKEDSDSLLWMNPVFYYEENFQKVISENNWNLGGDRNWIAPEIQYIILGRSDPNKVAIPKEMDPGNFCLKEIAPNEFVLSQDVMLTARNVAIGKKELHLESRIRQIEDPLRVLQNYDELIDTVTYIGYEQEVCLTEKTNDDIKSELWNLVQLYPGGEIIIPCSSGMIITDYATQPIDKSHYKKEKNHARFRIDGSYMYKVGINALNTYGRLGYLCTLMNETAYLVVRNYFNNPSSKYIEEPAWKKGHLGDSIHIYNDGGRWGGFGELEVHGQTIGGDSGRSQSRDLLQLWIYVGVVKKIRAISDLLLGSS